MRWPITRAMMTLGPPAGNGTISLIGLAGKSSAIASDGRSSSNPNSTSGTCATTAREGDLKCRIAFEQLCCTRDEGRSLGLRLQDQSPNHRKLLRHNGRGGERYGKRREK